MDLPWQETVYSVKVGRVRAFPVALGLPRRTIASRDAHIWRSVFQKEDNNIPWTAHRWTSKCEIHCESCVVATEVLSAYACTRVLSRLHPDVL